LKPSADTSIWYGVPKLNLRNSKPPVSLANVDCPSQGLGHRRTTAAPGTTPPFTSSTVPPMLPWSGEGRETSSAKPGSAQTNQRAIRYAAVMCRWRVRRQCEFFGIAIDCVIFGLAFGAGRVHLRYGEDGNASSRFPNAHLTNSIRSAVARSAWMNHSGTYSPFAIPCMEGKHTPSRDIWMPHSEDNVSLFEGSGGLLSGAKATSCEAKATESAEDRCQQDRRLSALRFSTGAPYGSYRDPRPAPDLSLPKLVQRQAVQMKNRVSGC